MKTKPASTLPRGDQLAIERTLLAVERTFLAYFRTGVVFLTSGLAILNIEFFAPIRQIALVLIGLSPLVFGVGILRFVRARKRILAHGQQDDGTAAS